MDRSSEAGVWMTLANSLLMESTALKTELMASGFLKVLSETPATNAFVFLPTFVLVMSILSGMLDLMRVRLPDLNLIMLPVAWGVEVKTHTHTQIPPLLANQKSEYLKKSGHSNMNLSTNFTILNLIISAGETLYFILVMLNCRI